MDTAFLDYGTLPTFVPTWAEIYDAFAKRLVKAQVRGDLMLLNYTQKAVYERAWAHPAVKACRGLILNKATGEVVALPFPKFFNFGEPVAEGITPALPSGEPEYTEKLDGALGILYRHPDTGVPLWATRGSFDSLEAQTAQRLWDTHYSDSWTALRLRAGNVLGDWTILVEILAPTTRQVVKYGWERLVLIGARNRMTGEDVSHRDLTRYFGPLLGLPVAELVTDTSTYLTRPGTEVEGVVARYQVRVCPYCDGWETACKLCGGRPHPVYRVKLKSADYFRLHRIKNRCTPRRVVKAWMDGSIAYFRPAIPEEYAVEVDKLLATLEAEHYLREATIMGAFHFAPECATRKEFAQWVNQHITPGWRGHMFRLYDNKPIDIKREVGEQFLVTLPPDPWNGEDE